MISLDDSATSYRATMPCGHTISTESMTNYLLTLAKDKKHEIKCPGMKVDNKLCGYEWEYSLCKKIGVLTLEESKEIEIGLS